MNWLSCVSCLECSCDISSMINCIAFYHKNNGLFVQFQLCKIETAGAEFHMPHTSPFARCFLLLA